MNYLIKTGRVFYAVALLVYGLQQFYFGTFRNVFFSPYQNQVPGLKFWAYIFGVLLILTGLLVLYGKFGKAASLSLGAIFLLLFFSTHLPYAIISEQNKLYHQGLWTNQLKEIALAGSSFVVAGSFKNESMKSKLFTLLEKFIPYGNLLFLFTIIIFGTGHMVYLQYIAIPDWLHDKTYWTYFTGIALLSSGIAIALGVTIRPVALLLSIMIFSWVWLVHLPDAVANPITYRGNSVASLFDALAFSGTSLLIAFTMNRQKWVEDLKKYK